jgi:hypothetical protein
VTRQGFGLAVAILIMFATPRPARAQETTNAWDAAHASAAVTICVRSLGPSTTMTQEAVHRIEAELSASGFLVDVAESDTGAGCAANDPSIKLRPSPTGIDISASAGPGDNPVLQTVNANDLTTTAELIAIRAVEGLRAAMIQALRRSPDGGDAAPESVRRFTRQQEDELPAPAEDLPPAVAQPEGALPPESAPPGGRRAPGPRPGLLLTLGGSAVWDGATPGMNAAFGVAWLLPPLALGIGFDAGIVPGSWNAALGSVEVRPFGITGNVALRLPCGSSWECQLGVGAGLRQFSLSATSAPGVDPPVTAQENHSSAVVMADALLAYFPTARWGLFLRGQCGTLLDAPSITVEDATMTWGRPSIGITLGGAARF